MSILTTKVVPIEYDEKTKRKAQKIEKMLDKNPEFFRVFLKGDKISLIDGNAPIFVAAGKTILKYLDGISAYDATGFLRENYLSEEEQPEVTYYWNSRETEDFKYSRIREAAGVYDYFHHKKDYQGLKEYLNHPSTATKENIQNWLMETYRYQLTNYLLLEIVMQLNNYYFQYFNQEIGNVIDQTYFIAEDVTRLGEGIEEEINITFPMTPNESIALCQEFLQRIDPSLNLLQDFFQLQKENRIISNKKIVENNKDENIPQTITANDGSKYIYMLWTNTISDAVALIHEFFHYIEQEEKCIYDNEKGNILTEIVPIFFETLMCDFLISKNYPKEEVDKIKRNRLNSSSALAYDIQDIMYLIEVLSKQEPITQEQEINMLLEAGDLSEDDSENLKKMLANENCDERNQLIIEEPFHYTDSLKYVLGIYYCKEALDRYYQGENIIPMMIELSKNIEILTPEEIETAIFEREQGKEKKLGGIKDVYPQNTSNTD